MILAVVVLAGLIGYIIYETHTDFTRLRALGGIALLVTIGVLASGKDKKEFSECYLFLIP